MNRVSSWFILFVFCYILLSNFVRGQINYGAPAPAPAPAPVPVPAMNAHPLLSNVFTVTDYGAIGDGVTDNSQAFTDTWKNACATGDSTIVVPDGTYLVNVIEFHGPCNGPIEFQLTGTIVASPDPSFGHEYWIMFAHVDGLTISGTGTFDGNGASTWEHIRVGNYLDLDLDVDLDVSVEEDQSTSSKPRPVSIKLIGVTNSAIDGITSINSKLFHFDIHECQGITMQNIKIVAPADSPNTDGIHIGHSSNIIIANAEIGTGDDCISIGDGSTNVEITSVHCGPGHGISVGSLGKYDNEQDVSGIMVANCSLTNTANGLRIKTWAPSPPSNAYNITFVNISIRSVNNPIIIDQHYCPHSSCQKEGESSVAIKDVKFINIRGESSVSNSVILQCSQTTPCQGIQFSQIKLTLNGEATTATCFNADNTFLEADQVPSQCSA